MGEGEKALGSLGEPPPLAIALAVHSIGGYASSRTAFSRSAYTYDEYDTSMRRGAKAKRVSCGPGPPGPGRRAGFLSVILVVIIIGIYVSVCSTASGTLLIFPHVVCFDRLIWCVHCVLLQVLVVVV